MSTAAKEDTPYLMRNPVRPVATASSRLVSSSVFLNDPRLRDWIATHFLRKSGKDHPTTADAHKLYVILKDLWDYDRIEELFAENRRHDPALDQWFSAGFVSTYGLADLLAYPEGTVGRIYGRYLADNKYDIDIVARFEPKSQFEYYSLRSGQTHDLEHILFGGGFDILGELVPYYVRLSNVPRFLDADLAGWVNAIQIFGSTRILMRTGLHYQAAYPMALKAVAEGIRIGESIGPVYLIRYEDVFGLSLADAREALGVRDAADLDTRAASFLWDEF